ncbi:MAG: hypothetical protein M1812_005886 [Candelaria pacifica]|nr:MAG: hypothetical protein M1812_005886 [Candelaria pacifica]
MARMPIEASRRAIMGHPRWLANPAALGRANNFGSGDNLNALGRQEMVRAAPLLQRPRRARRPSSSGLSSSDSSLSVRGLGMRRNHGVRPIHRTRGPPPPNYARQRPPPLHEHMGPPRAYNARQPLGRRYRPHGGGHMGGAGAVDLPMRHPRNVYHSETSSDKTEFDSSENEYSESGFGSYHDPSSYTGHFAESSSDSDRYDRRYNGRAGRVGGPNPRDPFRTGRRLGSDESTYSDRYGGYRGNSSDAYD